MNAKIYTAKTGIDNKLNLRITFLKAFPQELPHQG